MSNPVLKLENVTMQFGGVVAVDNLSMEVGEGEIVALIGPNGAGKTTIFNLLTKVYQPTHGTILLNGKDIHDLNTAQVNRAGIARTFQNIRLFGELSVEENITVAMDTQMHYTMPEGIFRLPRFWKEERVQALTEFGGFCWRCREHSMSGKVYGYRIYGSKKELSAGYGQLMEEVASHIGEGLSATVYTQLSDVEEEVNGIYTYDREVLKIDENVLIKWNERCSI